MTFPPSEFRHGLVLSALPVPVALVLRPPEGEKLLGRRSRGDLTLSPGAAGAKEPNDDRVAHFVVARYQAYATITTSATSTARIVMPNMLDDEGHGAGGAVGTAGTAPEIQGAVSAVPARAPRVAHRSQSGRWSPFLEPEGMPLNSLSQSAQKKPDSALSTVSPFLSHLLFFALTLSFIRRKYLRLQPSASRRTRSSSRLALSNFVRQSRHTETRSFGSRQ